MTPHAPQAASAQATLMSTVAGGRRRVRFTSYLRRQCPAVLGLCLFAVLPGSVAADGLRYSVYGVDGALKDNIEAWLGEPPDTSEGRENFIAAAQERVLNALQALGYYAAAVELDVNRDRKTWRLKVQVSAGEPVRIREVEVRVAGEIADTDLLADVLDPPPLRSGEVFNHGTYEELKSTLLGTAQRHGFFDGRFTRNRVAVSLDDKTADIELAYDSGPRYRFGELEFESDQISR